MIKFRNISPDARHIGPDGPVVERDAVTEILGEVVEETDDAYVVELADSQVFAGFGEPDDRGYSEPRYEPLRQAWPRSTWHLVGSRTRAASKSDDTANEE